VHKDSYEKAIKKFIQEYRNLPRTLGVLGLGNVGCAVAQIDAYKEGVPGNGEPFPDGAKMAKIHWNPKKQETYPGQPTVPGTQHDVDFMVKDRKRFADRGGWGWGAFEYDAASDTFRPATVTDKPPQENDAKCGFASRTTASTTFSGSPATDSGIVHRRDRFRGCGG
jgi:hypothetical protein